ncbi:MAG: macro domain-containing protein [Myxococcota bacterium]
MVIRSGEGDLLNADVEALVNTVNCVGVMGKGIALQFKKAWPEMFKDYKAAVKTGEVKPGHIHIWATRARCNPRFVLNFPTKRHWRSRSRMEDIDTGLSALVEAIHDLKLQSIAIPPLGAGHGKLDWSVVRPRIIAALEPLDEVEVWLWEPR